MSHFANITVDFDLFRMLIVMIPAVVLTHQFIHREHQLIRWVGALFAHIWQFQWRLILFASGIQLGLWTFSATSVLLYGVPTDIILGCGLLLGVLPRVIAPHWPISLLLLLDLLLTLTLLPLSYTFASIPFLVLVSAIVIIPSQLLARWTEQSSHIVGRSILQNSAWTILLLWLFPSILFNLTSDSWTALLQRPIFETLLYLTPIVLPAALLLNALYVFAKQGNGTAFPYDAPQYLVTTGVYRYLSNPMQVGIVLMMLIWGVVIQSTLVMLSAAVAFILFLVFKNVCNGSCQLGLTDHKNWEAYQASVPKWLPHFKRLNVNNN